jgi:hypothetical protein
MTCICIAVCATRRLHHSSAQRKLTKGAGAHLHSLDVEEASVADECAAALAAGQARVVHLHQPHLLSLLLLQRTTMATSYTQLMPLK